MNFKKILLSAIVLVSGATPLLQAFNGKSGYVGGKPTAAKKAQLDKNKAVKDKAASIKEVCFTGKQIAVALAAVGAVAGLVWLGQNDYLNCASAQAGYTAVSTGLSTCYNNFVGLFQAASTAS